MGGARWPTWAPLLCLAIGLTLCPSARADVPPKDTTSAPEARLQEARLLVAAATRLQAQGDYKGAIEIRRRAVASAEAMLGPDHPDVALLLARLALLYRFTGEAARAEAAARRALTIQQASLRPDHPEIAESLLELGWIYLDQGDTIRAEPMFARALALREKAFGPDHPAVADALGGVAELYLHRGGDDVRAVEALGRALGILEKQAKPDYLTMARFMKRLATIHASQGELDKAEPLYQDALTIKMKLLGPVHPSVAAALADLALFLVDRGDSSRAGPLYRRALAIWEMEYGKSSAETAFFRRRFLGLYLAEGRVEEAVRAAWGAADFEDREMVQSLAGGSQDQKRITMGFMADYIHEVISLHVQSAPDHEDAARLALTTILRHKGRILSETAVSLAVARRSLDPRDRDLVDRLVTVYSLLAREIARQPDPAVVEGYRKNLATLEKEREELESALGTQRAVFLAEQRLVTLADVQERIPEGAALVEIARYRPRDRRPERHLHRWGHPRYVAYVLRRKGGPTFADLGESFPIDRAVDKLRRALSDHDRSHDPRPAARAVDHLLMEPIRKLLGETRWALVSPQGPLHLVPLGALVDEEGHYLAERYLFSYLTTGRDLLRYQGPSPSPREGPVVLANPAFGEGGAPRALEGARRGIRSIDMVTQALPPLESTVEEASTITRLFPRSRLLLGAQATEAAIKSVHGPLFLHLATHGFFLPEQEIPGELFRTSGERVSTDEYRALKQRENPLLRSGIALAGFNERSSGEEDGVLTALEAAGLDLYGTRLVVLSTCESGVGEATSDEGVYGLRRALEMAGAETQVISLWQVDTGRTREMMQAYYERLQRGEGRSEAMRNVEVAMLANPATAHPNLWSSFIVSGDWRTLDGEARLPDVGKVTPGARGCNCTLAEFDPSGAPGWPALALVLAALAARRGRRLRRLFMAPVCAAFLAACSSRPAMTPAVDDGPSYPFSGKTVLYYDPSHGNQIGYDDPNGRSYLWYPTNRISLVGEWRMEERGPCYRFGESSYNPITGEYGGKWECWTMERLSSTVVDMAAGDVFGLASEDIPFRLPAHPAFRSIAEVKAVGDRR